MKDLDKIKQMQKEGKINPQQAELLLSALKESEERKVKVFQQIKEQKQERQNKAWGFIGVWLVVALVAGGAILYLANVGGQSRDIRKAMSDMNEASIQMGEAKYQSAADLLKKAIKKAPHYAPVHVLLGASYLGMLDVTKDENYREAAHKAFAQAKIEATRQKGGKNMNGTATLFFVMFLILTVGLVGGFLAVLYNVLVKKEESVNESWAQIGTLFRRKTDLVPALLEVVKNYSDHEQGTLRGVINARQQAVVVTDKLDGKARGVPDVEAAYHTLEAGLGKVSALAEQYPDLKANVHYKTMQDELRDTEDQLTSARKRYNRSVRSYNAALKVFPFNLMAAMFAFQPKGYFADNN